MRHLTSNISRIRKVGYEPRVGLSDGIGPHLRWIRDQGDVHDCFAEAEKVLRKKRIMHDIGFIDS